jgi:hypothetical protein
MPLAGNPPFCSMRRWAYAARDYLTSYWTAEEIARGFVKRVSPFFQTGSRICGGSQKGAGKYFASLVRPQSSNSKCAMRDEK